MAIHIEPESAVPMRPATEMKDLGVKAAAAAQTVEYLHANGLEVKAGSEDKDVAAALAVAYEENPGKTSKSAVQVRHLVTNKLIEETENPDPRIRIRALELLGKISDVGLFAEKSEVTVTHQTTDDLKDKLREKLTRLVNPEVEDAVILDDGAIDVDRELGLDVD